MIRQKILFVEMLARGFVGRCRTPHTHTLLALSIDSEASNISRCGWRTTPFPSLHQPPWSVRIERTRSRLIQNLRNACPRLVNFHLFSPHFSSEAIFSLEHDFTLNKKLPRATQSASVKTPAYELCWPARHTC